MKCASNLGSMRSLGRGYSGTTLEMDPEARAFFRLLELLILSLSTPCFEIDHSHDSQPFCARCLAPTTSPHSPTCSARL